MDTSVTDLPDLAGASPLSAEQIAAYQRDGHTVLRGVASPAEVAAYGPHIARAALHYSTETRPLHPGGTRATGQRQQRDRQRRRLLH